MGYETSTIFHNLGKIFNTLELQSRTCNYLTQIDLNKFANTYIITIVRQKYIKFAEIQLR